MAKREKRVDLAQLKDVVDEIVGRMGVIEKFGKAADHIKGMADIETEHFGIAVVTVDGDLVTGADADTPFPIQSISKVFALTLALRAFDDEVWKRVGREPSGDPFNSIVDLERHKGIPRNPFINPGALVVCDMLLDIGKEHGVPKTVREFLIGEIGEKDFGEVSEIVKEDGKTSGYSNRALANLSKHFENLHHDVEAVMKLYVAQCAIELDCRQLALAGRYLMRDGADGKTEDSRHHARLARRINSLMMTCGQYDGSGDFAFRVGLPAKSGVGGGILAIAPDIASVAVWSPTLDENGNSLLGTLALEQLTERMGWSIFG
ncbi:glutaminase [Mesorhizobium sp. CAU 1732]|uniref:glutaminase n=1 Tax=Mesorhizobium sp. CAU 1732 TaxID=3140358 RepID=UPI0032607567